MENPFGRLFFDGYLASHFRDKLITLHNIIKNYEELKPTLLEDADDIDDSDYIKSIRIDIRQTYFQAIECLFEMVFALEGREGLIDNENVWFLLSTSKGQGNYPRIDQIAKGEIGFLENLVEAAPNARVSLIEYQFYFTGVDQIPRVVIDESIATIKRLLIEFAKDFSDRKEYNAIKHAVRLFPLMEKFEIINPVTKQTFSRDMRDSLSYLTFDKETKTLTQVTTTLETERDVSMGILCSAMIANIIRSRKLYFSRKGSETTVALFTFGGDALDKSKHRPGWTRYKMSWTLLSGLATESE